VTRVGAVATLEVPPHDPVIEDPAGGGVPGDSGDTSERDPAGLAGGAGKCPAARRAGVDVKTAAVYPRGAGGGPDP
jgi:hypothetical protein